MNRKTHKDNGCIVDRILRQCEAPNLIKILAKLQTTDLSSLLLHVFDKISKKKTAKELLSSYEKSHRYLGVSELDQREIVRFDSLFYQVAPKTFQAVELSPIGPLGTNAILTKINQKNVLSTIRNSEVVSDPTVMLALEAAIRRNKTPSEVVRFCTSKRLLRLQPFDTKLGYMQHFKCFAMCTAARNNGCYDFLAENALEHIATYLDLIKILNQDTFVINDVVVLISDIRIMEKIISQAGIDRKIITRNTQNPDFNPFKSYGIILPSIIDDISAIDQSSVSRYQIEGNIKFLARLKQLLGIKLQESYPWARINFDLARTAGIGYYDGFCFHIYGKNDQNIALLLSDGGLCDWTQKLLNNKKELLITSGFGADLVHKMFRKTTF